MKPKAVLFDLSGTLISNPPRDEYAAMVDDVRAALGIESDEFHARWMEVNDHRLLGSFGSSEGEIADIAAKFGLTPTNEQVRTCVETRRSAVKRWMAPKPGAEEALRHIAERGVRMCLVTDCTFDVPALWGSHPLAQFFDAAVFSCVENVRKPAPHVYETALKRLGVSADEALFIGDGGSGELTGAVSVGIDAALIVHSADDPARLMKVGVEDWQGRRLDGFRGVMELLA
jgi:putative hydrolase of the HAD superfamily